MDTQRSRSSPSSSKPTGSQRSYGSERRLPNSAHNQDFGHEKSVKESTRPSHLHAPRTSHKSKSQDTIPVHHRSPTDLYEDSFNLVELDTGTQYPCTQDDLNASGGANRRSAIDGRGLKNRTWWFAGPNIGLFLDARIAAREVYDHNDPKRQPSAAEDEAIGRLVTGIKNANWHPWGPDLAIKAFCDLDKVFFCGRLRGHVCLSWRSYRAFQVECWGETCYLGDGKTVIHLSADAIFFWPEGAWIFVQMFATLLHEMCHAYLQIRAFDFGPNSWRTGKPGGHGKNFGSMIYAVNRRMLDLFGFEGDTEPYLPHDYAHNDHPSRAPKHSPPPPAPAPPPHRLRPDQPPRHPTPPPQPPPHHPPPRNPNKPTTTPKSRQDLYHNAFNDVSLDSGTTYPCTQSDLDTTGGLSRHEYPKDDPAGHLASRKKWFAQPNHGPFISGRQASLDIFRHNDMRRKSSGAEREAIERLSHAISAARHGSWGPDLIIKAFCDLDTVFFCGRLRGHVCVRWLPDWEERGRTTWGSCVFLSEGKCAIRLNADRILVDHRHPLERMFATMLHEMCHADAYTQLLERDILKCASHGKNFGTKYYAVEKRAKALFGFSLTGYPGEKYPRHKYEKGEGFP